MIKLGIFYFFISFFVTYFYISKRIFKLSIFPLKKEGIFKDMKPYGGINRYSFVIFSILTGIVSLVILLLIKYYQVLADEDFSYFFLAEDIAFKTIPFIVVGGVIFLLLTEIYLYYRREKNIVRSFRFALSSTILFSLLLLFVVLIIRFAYGLLNTIINVTRGIGFGP